MNTLSFITHRLHSSVEENQLPSFFSSNKVLNVNVTAMARRVIEKDCMICFYAEYLNLGGNTLPKEVVNMVIQRVLLPQEIACKKSIKTTIFLDITKQIAAMQIKRKEIWRLSCIFTEKEYGFTMNYWVWSLKNII